MYRLAGLGASGCTVPSECVQAAKLYPQHINVSLVDDYCTWEAQGKGGEVEVLCLQAIMKGQAAPGFCLDDADCDQGICEDNTCHALPEGAPETSDSTMLAVTIGLGVVGGLIYHWRKGAK